MGIFSRECILIFIEVAKLSFGGSARNICNGLYLVGKIFLGSGKHPLVSFSFMQWNANTHPLFFKEP